MHIYPFEGFIPDLNRIRFDESFYENMRDDFNKTFDQGHFKTASQGKNAYFVLEVRHQGLQSTGLISLTAIEEYKKKHIRPHEQTIAKKERIHQALLQSRKAMIKPVALLMPRLPSLYQLLNQAKSAKPLVQLKYPDEQTLHSVWIIDDKKRIQAITRHFLIHVSHALIADGHHRFASLSYLHSIKTPQKILTVYFAPSEMRVATFFRIMTPLRSMTVPSILTKLKNLAQDWQEITGSSHPIVHDPNLPEAYHLIHRNKIYRFHLKGGSRTLMPLRFSKLVTQDIFDITDETKSKRIKYAEYLGEREEIMAMQQTYTDDFVFIPPTLSTDQILINKKLLPPKSTLFSPRIINGLVVAINARLA